jgi:hypothetical protein
MSSIVASLALSVSTGTLLALPLTPALRELFSKRDAGPLVIRIDDGKIDNFAKSLRARCQTFEPWVTEGCRNSDDPFALMEEKLFVARQEGRWRGPAQTDFLVLCLHRTELPDDLQSLGEFYCRGSVYCGANNIFRVLLSDEDIALQSGTRILRWVHAENDLAVGNDCILFGRASAGATITLSEGCRFERIHAPAIYSSAAAPELDVRTESAAFSRLARAGVGRTWIHGGVQIRTGEQRGGDVVATKGVSIWERAAVFGSVKANGNAYLHCHAEVHGSLISTRRIHVASGCFIQGPVIAEQEIFIDSGTQVGLPAHPTTVSAPRIHIAPGAVVHGTVWARLEGRVGD